VASSVLELEPRFTQRFVLVHAPFRLATGDFVRQLIDDRIAEIANDEDGEHDDVASAKPTSTKPSRTSRAAT
jgi:hypothetical protein